MDSKTRTARDVFEKFIKAYCLDRDLKICNQILDDNVTWVGIGSHEVCNNKEELLTLMQEEFALSPLRYTWNEQDVRSKKVTPQLTSFLVLVKILSSEEFDFKMHLRGSVLIEEKSPEVFKIVDVHISVPNEEQQAGEYFPLSIAEEENILHRNKLYDKNVPGGMIGSFLDKDFSFYFITQKLVEYLGYENIEEYKIFTNNKNLNSVHPDDRDFYVSNIEKQLKKSNRYRLGYRLLKADGKYLDVVEVGAKFEILPQKNATSAVIYDITKEKQAHKQELFARNNAELAIKFSGLNFWEYDFRQDLLSQVAVHQDFSHLNTYLENYPYCFIENDLIYPTDVGLYIAHCEKIKRGLLDHTFFKSRLRDIDGHYQWRSTNISVIYDDDGNRAYAVVCSQDIQEKQELQERMNTTFRQMGITSWVYDSQKKYVRLYTNLKNIFPKNEWYEVPDCWFDQGIIRGNDIEVVKNFYQQIDKGEKNSQAEFRLYEPFSDNYRYYQAQMTAIKDINKGVLSAIGSLLDITDSVKTKKNYQRLVAFQEEEKSLELKNYEPGSNTSILWDITNGKLLAQHGYEWLDKYLPLNELKLNDFFDFLTDQIPEEEEKENFRNTFFQQNILTEYIKGHYEIKGLFPFNSPLGKIWLKINLLMMQSPENDNVIARVITNNVTEKVKIEKLMNTVVNEQFDFIALVEPLQDKCLLVVKKEGLFSEYAKRINFTFSEYIEIIYRKLKKTEQYPAKEDVLQQLRESFEEGQVVVENFQTAAGKIKSLTSKCLQKENLEFCVFCSDVTEITRQERRINEILETSLNDIAHAKKIAENVSKIKSNFLAKMSHDMRTPMNTIIGLANFGLEAKNAEKREMYFEQILESSKYLMDLLNDVLDMQFIEKQKIKLRPKVIKQDDFIKKIENVIKPQATKKEIKYEHLIIGENPEFQKFDILRIQQVLINLMNNCLKYTPLGGELLWQSQFVEVEGQACFRNIVTNNRLELENAQDCAVEDSLDRQNTNEDQELILAKDLVSLIGGKITCHSKFKEGVFFQVCVPIEIISKKEYEKVKHSKKKELQKIDFSNRKVLICEDNEINAKIFKKLLEEKKMNVDLAANGKIALLKVENNDYDLILMDIHMPEMNGLEATVAIREFDQETPIVALSANAYDRDILASLEVGMNAHLAKPIEKDELYQTIAEFLV